MSVPPIPVNSYRVTPDLVIDCARLVQKTLDIQSETELSQLIASDIFLNLEPFIVEGRTSVVTSEVDAGKSKVFVFDASLAYAEVDVVILVFQMQGDGYYPISHWGMKQVPGLKDGAMANNNVVDLWTSVQPAIEAAVRKTTAKQKVVLTVGQQVNAAVASVASISLASTLQSEGFVSSSIVFGCPRFGNVALSEESDMYGVYQHRINLAGDPQTSTPPLTAGYVHFGREQNINGSNSVTYCANNSTVTPRQPGLLWLAIACCVLFILSAAIGLSGLVLHSKHVAKPQHSYASHKQSFHALLMFFAVFAAIMVLSGLTAWNAWYTANHYPEEVQRLLVGAAPQAETAGNLCIQSDTGGVFLTYAAWAVAAFVIGALLLEELGPKHSRFALILLSLVIVTVLIPAFAAVI